MFLYSGLVLCTQSQQNRVKRWARSGLNDHFWNNTISLIAEPYLVLVIATFLHVKLINEGNVPQTSPLSDSIAITLLVVVLAFPIVIYVLYKAKMKRS